MGFSTFDMDQFAKNFLTVQQRLHVWLPVVLCTCPVLCLHFAIYFFLSLAKCGQMLTICLSYLVFSRYATDWTLLIPFLALSSIFVFCRHNLELILDRFLFIIPCVFPAFYMYIIEPILGFVYLRYWIPVKGRLRMAFLD